MRSGWVHLRTDVARQPPVCRHHQQYLPCSTQVALRVRKHLVEVRLLEPLFVAGVAGRCIKHFPLRFKSAELIGQSTQKVWESD